MHNIFNLRNTEVIICIINVKEFQRGNQKWTIYRTGNTGHIQCKATKSKTKTQHNMYWTPLYVNKNTTQYVLDTTIPTQTQIT